MEARSAAVSTAAILAATNSAAAVPAPQPRAAAVPPPEPRAVAVPPHPSHRQRRPRHPSHRQRRPRHPSHRQRRRPPRGHLRATAAPPPEPGARRSRHRDPGATAVPPPDPRATAAKVLPIQKPAALDPIGTAAECNRRSPAPSATGWGFLFPPADDPPVYSDRSGCSAVAPKRTMCRWSPRNQQPFHCDRYQSRRPRAPR